MAQEHKTKQKSSDAHAEESKEESVSDVKNAELAEETDDLLAEIDDVLEENAEQFVKDYIQKGGQ